MKTYPHIGARNKLPFAPVCCVCGRVATWRIDIQVSYFRGDDEVRDVCHEHRQLTAAELMSPQAPAPPPALAWMTPESESQLRSGGNDSRGTVPVHASPSSVATIALVKR